MGTATSAGYGSCVTDMTALLVLPVAAPVAAAVFAAVCRNRRLNAAVAAAAALAIGACGLLLAVARGDGPALALGGLLRADALTAVMLVVIGSVGAPAAWAGIGYVDQEVAAGHTTPRRVRLYGVLVPTFLAAMATAVSAANIGVMWAAIEATTIVTAFLVGHRGGRAAVEAAWKYVVICSVGIAVALLGTVLVYFAAVHAGIPASRALDIDTLLAHATALDPAVLRVAAGLMVIGFGAKAGLVPFHTWLADAHSQAPAPVSALMSGVLLAVGFSAVLRVKPVVDLAVGGGYLRTALLVVGLATVAVAALMLLVQRDFKRMLAYSSMENLGVIAVAAAVGTPLAIAALLWQVLAHGMGKTVLFLSAGQIQSAHGSSAIAAVRGVLARSRLVGASFAVGIAVVVAVPPFAIFGSVIAVGRSMTEVGLGWLLAVQGTLMVVAFAALASRTVGILLGEPEPSAPAIMTPRSISLALVIGIAACLALGLSAGPLAGLFRDAGLMLAGGR